MERPFVDWKEWDSRSLGAMNGARLRDEHLLYGGEGGIRTHGPFQDNGFRDRPIRPLSHLSVPRPAKMCSLAWSSVTFK